ncbi:response regulator transcription factor [Candidatus Nitrotoga sp. M5]|uniref:response regulator transcription factor n=1 Tax=Candidatus Nitrotoga sp. M5 TaxID=2890409 RepID=UPI001EF671D8|nr:response regulator [Candidatus Nitrotoga sp. M5]CAH1387492.1 Response regulator receiver domain-containing protein [Candidatus Nitrotoga sp. M5]
MSKVPVIAIVDDDEAMREALSNLLQVMGYSTATFENAENFLAENPINAFDCLITDVKMPGMGGLELQKILHEMGSSMPVIIITSHTDPTTLQRALEEGAYAYISKPFADEELLQHLRLLLDFEPSRDGNVK